MPKTSLPTKQLVTAGVVFLFLLTQLVFLSLPHQEGLASDLTATNILNAVNKERSIRNLLTLNTDARLTAAAQYKAQDMIDRNYFSHVDPDGNYIWPKIVAEGYTPYLELGENLAIDFSSTEGLMDAWMNSPTHRANILQEGFRDQGAGVSFGNPSGGQYSSSIANTFGALVPPKVASAATAASPKPAPAPAPAPKPSAPPSASPAPAPVPAPTGQPTGTPIFALRGDNNLTLPNFAFPSATAPTTQPAGTPQLFTSPAVQPPANNTLDFYGINRKIILVFGAVILLLLLGDLKDFITQKTGKLDKKINNLLVLLISLVVAALMYWF